jgi:hypothetical protein
MFIVWGKKLVYRKIGFVADLCPICRTVQAFVVKRVGLAGHIYYISAGEGTLAGFERTCLSCATTFVTDPGKYKEIVKKSASLAELQARTFPDIDVVLHDRLQLEARVINTPLLLSSEERTALIRDPFLLLASKVEKRYASTHLDKEAGLTIVAALALMIVGPAVSHALLPDAGPETVMVFIVLAIALIGWQIVMAKSRFMKRQVIPVLVKALLPLKPTESELKATIAELSKLGHKIATKLKLPDLQSQLSPAGPA